MIGLVNNCKCKDNQIQISTAKINRTFAMQNKRITSFMKSICLKILTKLSAALIIAHATSRLNHPDMVKTTPICTSKDTAQQCMKLRSQLLPIQGWTQIEMPSNQKINLLKNIWLFQRIAWPITQDSKPCPNTPIDINLLCSSLDSELWINDHSDSHGNKLLWISFLTGISSSIMVNTLNSSMWEGSNLG